MLKRLCPDDGSIVRLLTKEQYSYAICPRSADPNEVDWLNLVESDRDRSAPAPVILAFTPAYDGIVRLGMQPDLSDAVELPAVSGRAEAMNLLLDTTYYWQAVTAHGCTDIGHFRTDSTAPRMLYVDGISNVRDFGGFRTRDGRRVRQGMLYRTSELDRHVAITPKGRETLYALGVRTDLDIRGASEEPHPILDESRVRYVNVPLNSYDTIFIDEQKPRYRKTYDIASDRANYPMFIHCWGGIDRTGCWLFLLGAMLGVPEDSLMLDYEMSSFSIWGARSRKSEYFIKFRTKLAAYGDDVQNAAIAFLHDCGVTDTQMDAIRAILLED